MNLGFMLAIELLVIAGSIIGCVLDYDGASAGSVARQAFLAAIAVVCVIGTITY